MKHLTQVLLPTFLEIDEARTIVLTMYTNHAFMNLVMTLFQEIDVW